jgi:hypothetical protein
MRPTKIAVQKVLLASALLLSSAAQAVPITVSSDISNLFVDGASSATGRFDINASAVSAGINSLLSVTSATLSFSFSDNIDGYTTTSGFTGGSTLMQGTTTCGPTLGSCVEHYYWVDPFATSHADPIETARVTVGSRTADASSPYHQSVVGPYLTAQGQTVCGWLGCGFVPVTRSDCGSWLGTTFCTGPWPVYTQNRTYYSAYDGAFSLNLMLDNAALLDLGTDGLLDFSLGALAGNFNFLSASLTADVFARTGGPSPTDPVDPIDPVDPGPIGVPEPGSFGLLLAGFFALFAGTAKGRLVGRTSPIRS